ncbi:Scr1 family TA system antitoxin-like transcriptional regulator [Streptomyces sp. NPDC008150]|uniref:helix-turn-helix domain-containing protein n=1 Tax=Streptomyces sp. NPDC008150 TaxID=3364816 RepID=UPI0036EF0462
MNLKDLNPDGSPQAAFGAKLRRSREAHGWSQEELGRRMDYSGTHVSAVETGRKIPTLRFSRSADQALGTGDLFERTWREIRHGVLLEGFPEYVGYEGRAVEIRLYEIGIVPGLLQTPEYARILAQSAVERGAITPELAEERLAFLAERQQSLERPKPPMVFVVMDESCVRRPVGGAKVMAAQFDRLMEFARQPNTVLQVAPFAMGERRTLDLPVNLLTMSDRSVCAYAESQSRGHFDRESTGVVTLLTAYHQLQAEALSQASSVALITELRKGSP